MGFALWKAQDGVRERALRQAWRLVSKGLSILWTLWLVLRRHHILLPFVGHTKTGVQQHMRASALSPPELGRQRRGARGLQRREGL
jgi:hypothetical protein